jgi:hypothetical protein
VTANLRPPQPSGTLREIKKSGGALWRAYQLKESLRAMFTGDLDTDNTNTLWGSETRCGALTCTPRVLVNHG